ncbi:hypothetical protein SLEP1_g55599 [Rubroshorea leprosula]|uniref:Uncharacterized protein n=1 Tax=Rubroshorea leprosula TaxID=152421 RepID=A0AAV5MK32_9ROSI|nr:hypothetical protein SLEP1_g55599 [Rubroshorea leprosula]
MFNNDALLFTADILIHEPSSRDWVGNEPRRELGSLSQSLSLSRIQTMAPSVVMLCFAPLLLLSVLVNARIPGVYNGGSWQSAHATFYGDNDASGTMGMPFFSSNLYNETLFRVLSCLLLSSQINPFLISFL